MKKEYRVIESNDIDFFKDEISRLISNGWNLQGGVAVVGATWGTTYNQAIVKEHFELEDL